MRERIKEWHELDMGWVSSITGEIVDSRLEVYRKTTEMDAIVQPIVAAVRDGRSTGGQLAGLV